MLVKQPLTLQVADLAEAVFATGQGLSVEKRPEPGVVVTNASMVRSNRPSSGIFRMSGSATVRPSAI